jgi:hypothetical protein
MKLWERIIKHRLTGVIYITKKSIWIHTKEIDYGDDFLDKTTYGEMQRVNERHVYDFY